jgi:hypothetical protein
LRGDYTAAVEINGGDRTAASTLRLIELRKELNGLQLGGTTGGGITIESSEPNAVIAGGGLVNPEIGFSAPLRMDDPEMQAMRTSRLGQTLHALMVSIGQDSSMMGMGLPRGTLMNPIVNLRNVTDVNIGVKLVFRYQAGSSTQLASVTVNGVGFGSDSFMVASESGISILITNRVSSVQVIV